MLFAGGPKPQAGSEDSGLPVVVACPSQKAPHLKYAVPVVLVGIQMLAKLYFLVFSSGV